MRLLRSSLNLLVVVACAQAASACAGVRVYSDPALTHEIGVKVYAPKPYLLVARTGAKNAPVQVAVVYLPDANNASYIRQQRGWGSNDLSIGIQNGMLVQLGSKSDSHPAETLGSVADLVAAAGGAYGDVRPRATPEPEPEEPDAFELYEIRQELGRTVLVRVSIDRLGRD